jgi:rhodanese-related sulfurtransferase
MNAEQIIQQKTGSIVDVRTPEEYMGGHVANSINIPLQVLAQNIEQLKQLKQPIVLCCASGNRSGQATQFLTQLGIDCVNGGSWMDVNYYQSKTIA